MPLDSYEGLTEALGELGLTGQFQNPDQLIVSSQEGPVWPNRGNSFWLSRKHDAWYLSTWLPVGYKVPPGRDILALCSACMASAASAMWRVPKEIIAQFGLQELDETEYNRLIPTTQND